MPIGQAFFALLLIGQCVLVLSIPRFVTVDGPSHLGLATSFWDRLLNPSSVVREYTTAQFLPATNLIPDIPAGLLARAVPVEVVNKIIICLAVVGLPLAMAWALNGTSGRRWWLAFLVIPLSFTFTLQYGFYPYSTALVGLLVVMGLMVRLRRTRSIGTLAELGVVLTLTYMAHLMPFLLAVGFIACCAAVDAVLHRTAGEHRLKAFLPLSAAVPGLALSSVGFVAAMTDPWTRLVNDGLGDASGFSKARAVGVAQLGRGTVVFDSRERFLTSIVALVVAGLFVIAVRQRLRSRSLCGADAYLLFASVTLLMALTIPNSASFGAGGSHLSQRLALVPLLGLLLWIAESLPPMLSVLDKRTGIAVACGSLIVTIGLDAMRLPSYLALSRAALAYESVASCIAKNSSIVQVNLERLKVGPDDYVDPLTADTGRLTALRGGWDVGNIQAALPFFSLRNRPETNPYRFALAPGGSIEGIPPSLDPLAYARAAPGQLDYILVFGASLADPETLKAPGWAHLAGQLSIGYGLVAESPDSLLQVFELNGGSAREEGARARSQERSACPKGKYADQGASPSPEQYSGSAGPGGGGSRGRPDRVRAVSVVDGGWDPVRGRDPIEGAEAGW